MCLDCYAKFLLKCSSPNCPGCGLIVEDFVSSVTNFCGADERRQLVITLLYDIAVQNTLTACDQCEKMFTGHEKRAMFDQ